MSALTSARLTDLLRMRRELERTIAFLNADIAEERKRIAASPREQVIGMVADLYSVPIDAVFGNSRDTAAVNARHLAAWMLREHGMTLADIGKTLRRDHTTVLYAVRCIERDPARRALGARLLAQEEGAA